MLYRGDPEPIPLLSSGFFIMPNLSTARRNGSNLDRTLVTVVFQVSVEHIHGKIGAVILATNLLKDTVRQIRALVN